MFDVDYYDLPNGDRPVQVFIDKQTPRMQRKIFERIELLETHGNTLREPYSKFLGDGLFELRIEYASDITRIFFFFMIGEKIILTNGEAKKKNKTSRRALVLARKYKKEYEGRK